MTINGVKSKPRVTHLLIGPFIRGTITPLRNKQPTKAERPDDEGLIKTNWKKPQSSC